jgi:dinuclear metal center YbgI/SA1388 family protein
LPLDAHLEVGNNAVLARLLDVQVTDWWGAPTGVPLGVIGPASGSPPLSEMVEKIERKLHSQVRVLPHGPDNVETMAILSGFGADNIAEVKALGADTYLTGETSHADYWAAADYGLNVIYAGHYATETVGVQALGEHLAEKFGVEVKFFDFPTNM